MAMVCPYVSEGSIVPPMGYSASVSSIVSTNRRSCGSRRNERSS